MGTALTRKALRRGDGGAKRWWSGSAVGSPEDGHWTLGALTLECVSLIGYKFAPVDHISRGDDIVSSTTVLDDASVLVEHGLQ
jgi:hypothetical protein